MKKLLSILFFSLFVFSVSGLYSLDMVNIWRHSEIAGKNSVFCDVGVAPILFDNLEFNIMPLDIRIEYLPPIIFPFGFGIFMKTPNPNLKSYGFRIAYHFDTYDSLTDFYVVYNHDFGYLRNDLYVEYNDTPVEFYKYDFRIGVRRFFDAWFGIAIETGFHFESIIIMLSVKIN